jgi:thioredoxin-related protein
MKTPVLLVGLLAASSLSAQGADAKPAAPDTKPAAGAPDLWFADFDKAVDEAKKQKKDLLVDFTGSDWCGWCIKLDEEVFKHESFLTGAQKHFVLVKLDFPNAEEIKAKVPNPKRNQELQEKYQIQGFPSILMMTVDGEVFGKSGYAPGGPEKYLEMVTEKATVAKKRLVEIKELATKFAAADEKAADGMLETATNLLAGMTADDVGADKLGPIVKKAVNSTKADFAEKAVTALVKSGQADAEVATKAAAIDPKNAKGLLELCAWSKMGMVRDDDSAKAFLAALDTVISTEAKDAERMERMLAQASMWSAGPLQSPEGAKKYAEALKKRVTGTPRAEQFTELFQQVLGG